MSQKLDNKGNVISPIQVDAFGKTLVAQDTHFFDDRTSYARNTGEEGIDNWTYIASGGVATYNGSSSIVELITNTTSGSKVIRQTNRYFPYIPGSTNTPEMTATPFQSVEGVRQRIGQFDDKNGVYWEIGSGGQLGVGVRSDVTGTVVDSVTYVGSFNADRLDGSNKVGNESRLTFVVSASNIFALPYQWLGVGDVQAILNIREPVLAHISGHSNCIDATYMRTATLPLRYEIENLATITTTPTLKTICAALVSQGGSIPSGPTYIKGNGAVPIKAITARKPLCAFRLSNSYNGRDNRISAEFKSSTFYAEDAPVFFEVVQITDVGCLHGDPSWTHVHSHVSGVEFAIDVDSVEGGIEHTIAVAKVPAGGQGSGTFTGAGGAKAADVRDPFHFLYQNYNSDKSAHFVMYGTSIESGTAAIGTADLEWQELH